MTDDVGLWQTTGRPTTSTPILRGENPGDIPYYQASKFELSLNLKTAKALGLSLAPALLASADTVIE